MTHVRTRALIPLTLAVCALDSGRVATGNAMSRPMSTSVSQGTPKRVWTPCGQGKFDLAVAGQPIGTETFDVTCLPDGRYSATGRTQLSGTIAVDLTTALELDREFLPVSASAKGTVAGRAFEQSGTFANGTAALSTNGMSQSVAYTQGASWMGGNIFYPIMFIAARYDEAKGGVQQFPVFPTMASTLERITTDRVRGEKGDSATFVRYKLGLAGQEMMLWRDAAGRLAALAVPGQRFTVVRPEVATSMPALLASLTTPAPSSSQSASAAPPAIDYSAPAGASFTAEEVAVPVAGATYTLAGTLLVPKGGKRPYPVVVMVTGSGLQTRDSRIPIPGLERYAAFRQIAERLAGSGVAVLRVDDRGVGGSTGRETLESATTSTLANDTRAQIAWLRARSEIDARRIIV
jgi:hypothetical protein